MTVLALLRELGLGERKGVAVAINGNVVGRGNWPTQTLAAEDRVLVIQATQGG
jgi:sulfur carrier protein